MGYVPKTPTPLRTRPTGSALRDLQADVTRIDRKRLDPAPQVQLVKVEPEPSEHWAPGTAWLDTSGEP